MTTQISVAKGILQFKKTLNWTWSYRFLNTAAERRTVLVEHPVRGDRALVEPSNAVEKTPDVYRFSLEAPAGGSADLTVKESKTVVETQGLVSWRGDQLTALLTGNGPLSPAAKAALQKVADLKAKVDRTTQDVALVSQQKTDLESSQGRIRQNLEAVGRDSSQGQAYLKRLLDSESKIDQLTQQLTAAWAAQGAAQKDLEDSLRNLTVE